MNWVASRVTLRLRTLPEIFDLGFVFVASNRKAFGRIALATLLVPFAICGVLQVLHVDWFLIWCAAIALGLLVEGPFTVAAGRLLFAEGVEVRPVLVAFRRRFFSYVGARVVCAVALAFGAAFVLPLPAVAPRTLFVPEFCLLESASPGRGIKRGFQLMQGQSLSGSLVALALLTARFGFVVVTEELGKALVEFVFQLGRPLGSLFDDGGSTFALAGFFLSIPFLASTRFLAYVDQRTRREGWDIQVRFAGLVNREAKEEAAA